MIWIFRATMVAGLIVAVLSFAVGGMLYVNLADCTEGCEQEAGYLLLLPSLVLGVLGLIITYAARVLVRRLKAAQTSDPAV